MRKTTLQNKLTLNNYTSNGKQTASSSSSFTLFQSCLNQFWTSSKCLLALETTKNNQEVKRSLYRLQNVNSLPKDYIRSSLTCRSLVQLYRSCTSIRIYKYQRPQLINKPKPITKKIFDFYFDLVNQRFQCINVIKYADKIGLDSGVRNKGILTS